MKVSNLKNWVKDENFKKVVDIPLEVADIVNKKFNVKKVYKSFGRLFEEYYEDSIDNTIIVLDDFDVSIKADDIESKYVERRFNGFTPTERVYYSYKNELRYVFPEFDYLMATLISGDFKNMASEFCVPYWISSQILQAYNKEMESSNDISLDIEFKVSIDTDIMRNLLKDSELPFTFENREPLLSFMVEDKELSIYKKFMELLKEKNAPLKMHTRVMGYYDNDEESNSVSYLDNFDKDGFIVKDCGTVGDFNFDYKDMIDSIFNELHK